MRNLRRNPDVVYEVVDGQAVLLAPGAGAMLTLNPVGTLVWRALGEVLNPIELADTLQPSFPAIPAEQLRRDVTAFVAELITLGLVEHDEAPA